VRIDIAYASDILAAVEAFVSIAATATVSASAVAAASVTVSAAATVTASAEIAAFILDGAATIAATAAVPNVTPTLVAQLLDLDWREPLPQAFPSTASALASLLGNGVQSSHVQAIYQLTETSSTYADAVSGGTNNLTIAGSNNRRGVRAIGLYNGTDLLSNTCHEFTPAAGTSDRAGAGNSTLGEFVANDIGFLIVVFRGFTPSGPRAIAGKRSNVAAAGGWELQVSNTSGHLSWLVDGGSVLADATIASNHCTGAWHAAFCGTDLTSGNERHVLLTDGGSTEVTTSVVTATATGLAFCIGTRAGGGLGAMQGQIKYVAILKGIYPTQAMLDNFWKHGKQPTTPQLTTYSRSTLTRPYVGQDATGVRQATLSSLGPQVALGYSDNFAHSARTGLLIEAAATNLILHSQTLSNAAWVRTSISGVTDDAVETPHAVVAADTIATSGANGNVRQAATTTANTTYSGSAHARRNTTDQSCSVRLFNGSTDYATTSFTAESTWQRVTVTGSQSGTSTAPRAMMASSGVAVNWWGMQLEAGYPSSWIATSSATASRVATDAALTNTGGNTYVKSTRGEIEAVVAFTNDVDTGARTVFDVANPLGDGDRIMAEVQANGTLRVRIWDASQVLQQTITTADPGNWDQQRTIRVRWDSTAGGDGNAENADVILEGVRTAGSATTWTASTNATVLYVGSTRTATQYANALIARIRVWDNWRAA
jgi:hypothetical protein